MLVNAVLYTIGGVLFGTIVLSIVEYYYSNKSK